MDWPSTPPPSFFAPDTVREKKSTADRLRAAGTSEPAHKEQTMPIEILDEIQ